MKNLLILLITLSLILASCTDSATEQNLVHAEAIMEQHPDSALAILNSIDTAKLTSDKSRAKYALLATQASIKNRIVPPNDSLINTAVEYFKGTGGYDEMKSLFYQGNVRYYNSQYSQAAIPAIQSRDFAIKLNDDYWRAKSAEMIADIYDSTYYEDTIFRNEAIDYYLRAGKISNHHYAICDLAITIGNFESYRRAIHLLDSIAEIAKGEGDDALLVYSWQPLLSFYVKSKDFKDGKLLSEKLDSIDDTYSRNALDYTYHARVACNEGDYQTAMRDLNIARSKAKSVSNLIIVNQAFKDFYQSQNMLPEAIAYCDSMVDNIFDVTNDVLEQSVITVQRDYYTEISDKEAKYSKTLRIYTIVISAILLLLIIALLIIYRMHIKIKDNELDRKINDIVSLTSELDRHKKTKQEDTTIIGHLLYDHLELLNKLCNHYFENQNNDKLATITKKKIETEICNIRSRYDINEIGLYMNPQDRIFMDKLAEECPSLKKSDIHFISLIIMGLSSKAICILSDINIKNFYTKRARIAERIRKIDCPDKDMFISKILN